ncbi:hypothetical protein DFJ43DRAFT_82206 [Lentinula guzmanii]|uniref:Uncharacterized protein n=1 Tax=Lentinula guzmanii TaxID=2804957 RepID=A0AA38MU18_9AGAR|nr:hypothetical protein DFJ43DRAFT_82206 [Lentinula guzmanii]
MHFLVPHVCTQSLFLRLLIVFSNSRCLTRRSKRTRYCVRYIYKEEPPTNVEKHALEDTRPRTPIVRRASSRWLEYGLRCSRWSKYDDQACELRTDHPKDTACKVNGSDGYRK